MLQRQRVLIYLMKTLHELGSYTKTKADKSLFLLAKESGFTDKMKFYSFFPYKYGPFSALFYYDMRSLEKRDYLFNETPTPDGLAEAEKVDAESKTQIVQISKRFLTLNELRDYVYSKYPEYTVKSELSKVKKAEAPPGFFTIGYEGKDLDQFLDVLIGQSIQMVVDVRYNPFSMQFFFTRENLIRYLGKVGIDYVHLPELGIEGKYRKNLKKHSDYMELFKMYEAEVLNDTKLKKLVDIGRNKRIAILCREKYSNCCHRGIISSRLEALGYSVTHL